MTEDDIKKVQDWVNNKWKADEKVAQYRQ